MIYGVEFTSDAESDLSRLDARVAQRVLKRMHWLAESFDSVRPEALKEYWKGMFKLGVGDYRILYTSDKAKQEIVVHFVRYWREVYKIR